MNTPSTLSGNWAFRYREGQLTGELAGRLAALTRLFGR
jgi:4-alpha-glucanotransferase